MTVLFVPILPLSLNEWSRGHWSMRHRERDRWREAVGAVILRSRPLPILGPVRVCLTFYWIDRRRRDSDNVAKHPLDSLVHHGLIRDDGPPWLTETVLRSRLAPAPDRTGVVVQLHADDAPAWPLPVERKAKRPPVHAQEGASGSSPAILRGRISAAGLRDLARKGLSIRK